MAKASAVLNGRTEVAQEDIDRIMHLGNWINYRFNPLYVAHRGYDALLCNHVYMRFCPNCPQYKCRKRRV